ncbi:MAG TPA: DUF2344 domain-containing protein [Epulopiscium sp.]|nr:DUF2344 domain-containing protein [Candidatus Epulonipiscium sp.]
MKIRMKFSKEGSIKFVGHLDLLRLFQRAVKSAQLPVTYSQGFNPHSLLYFAQALSVGITSEGEYIEVHLDQDVEPEWVKNQMNRILPEGLRIQEVYILVTESKTCMALIDGSSYSITITKDSAGEEFITRSNAFYNQEEILVPRISKQKETIINIKEFIYELEIEEKDEAYIIHVTLAAGSRKNLNAKLFIASFIDYSNLELVYTIHRKELFVLKNDALVPLWKIGV